MSTIRDCIDNDFDRACWNAIGYTPDPPVVVQRDVVNSGDTRLLDQPNYHRNFFSLYVVQEGHGTHLIDATPYLIARGDVYVMRPGSTHMYTQCVDLTLDAVYFQSEVFDERTLNEIAEVPEIRFLLLGHPERAEDLGTGRWIRLDPVSHATIAGQVQEMRDECQSDRRGRAVMMRALLARLLIHVARLTASKNVETEQPSGRRSREATVTAAIRFMQQHLSEPLRVSEVAASVFLSPDRFTDIFSEVMGRAPGEHLQTMRIDHAQRLLATTDDPVTQIAQQAGFNQSTYFAKVFRQKTGMTPLEWRKRNRSAPLDLRKTH
jgi:AraC family L-rhamnose operon transcriptional activator RhaR